MTNRLIHFSGKLRLFLFPWRVSIKYLLSFVCRGLQPDTSPKKTIEGAVSGVAGSIAMVTVGAWYPSWSGWLSTGIALGLLIRIASLLGDLTESMMKRDVGVKDSGQLIPAHGGSLDRANSHVFTAPLVYYFVTLLLLLL